MRPFPNQLAVGILLIVVSITTAAPAVAQPVYTVEPPADVRDLLARVKRVDTRQAAINALAARDDAAPYLRLELRAATDRFSKLDLGEALAAIEDRAYARNKARFARWAAGRRFDLCNELIVSCPDKKDAVALIEAVTPELHAVAAEAARGLDFRFGEGVVKPLGSRFDRRPSHLHFADETVRLPRASAAHYSIVRADICEVAMFDILGWFVAVRSEIRYASDTTNEWEGCIVLVNNSMSIRRADSSLFISDGDVELRDVSRRHCVVIANGDIRSTTYNAADRSVLSAAGDIVLSEERTAGDNLLYARGAVTLAGPYRPSPRIKQKQKSLPFGVRFLDPTEFGLALAAQNGGVQVLGLAPDSPFARHGVADGDVITAIDDVKADAVSAFRRALRRGVLRESVVLRVRRDGKDLTRIVFLDGVPLPPAPPPREVTR